ncbi:unnamed protein product [Trichobilharzia szidati]|nr:unnamed protein product [Trichobilharzia szidati]
MSRFASPLHISRRCSSLWRFRYAGHSKSTQIATQALSIVTVPVGILITYIAFQNEHRHEKEMEGKEEFIVVYPREIIKLPWGDGKTALTDTISKSLGLHIEHEIKLPKPAE